MNGGRIPVEITIAKDQLHVKTTSNIFISVHATTSTNRIAFHIKPPIIPPSL